MAKRLAIVGAGPKAAAIVARAAILRDVLGAERVPEIIVLEQDRIASAWGGWGNYSNGFTTLCTPGEKDVGFPYEDSSAFGAAGSLAPHLFARFSWGAYLVATGRMADWVDRERDHPSHAQFADYLDWVFEEAELEPFIARVRSVQPYKDKWCIRYDKDGSSCELVVDGVVLTGNGDPREVTINGTVPSGRVFDAATFWPTRKLFTGDDPVQVVVAGDGGSAGTIVAWLADRFRETKSRVISVSPMGTLFPRGDGHAERRWFTDPTDWQRLSVEHRRKLIGRTEAGVVSLRNKAAIDRSDRVSYEAGHLSSIGWDTEEEMLALKISYGGATQPFSADFVVNAIGFDPWTRLRLVDLPAARRLIGPARESAKPALDRAREQVERAIEINLSMPATEGFPSGLHLPVLGALEHGPGLGNLGCLGIMASRVLDGYIS